MHLTIGKKLYLGFGVMLTVLAVTAGNGLRVTADLNEEIEQIVDRTGALLQLSGQVQDSVADLRALTGEMIAAAVHRDADAIARLTADIEAHLDEVTTITRELEQLADDERTRQLAIDVRTAIDEWHREAGDIARLAAAFDADGAARANVAARASSDTAETAATEIFTRQVEALARDKARAAAEAGVARLSALVLVAAGSSSVLASRG